MAKAIKIPKKEPVKRIIVKRIIAICGKIGSGKTTLSKLIAEKYNIPIASFGGYIKHVCEKDNLPTDRKSLQDKGNEFIETDPKGFLGSVIKYYKGDSDTIILDGVRHIVVIKKMAKLCSKSFVLFVETDAETIKQQYLKRENEKDIIDASKKLEQFDRHKVEFEIEQLKLCSDIIVYSNKNDNKIVFSKIEEFLANGIEPNSEIQ